MNIEIISTDDLRRMDGQEGLILQGCGGNLQEWVDGINKLLTQNGILKDGTEFQQVSTFENDGLTCLLFHFDENVKLNVGSLAMWRLATHEDFSGTWLSDYVPNRLGGFARDQPEQARTQAKPDCPLIGQDGNIFHLLGIASRTLKDNGQPEQAREMFERVTQSPSYDAALGIIGEYVNITSVDEIDMTEDFKMSME